MLTWQWTINVNKGREFRRPAQQLSTAQDDPVLWSYNKEIHDLDTTCSYQTIEIKEIKSC
jgi:hypothetical protein